MSDFENIEYIDLLEKKLDDAQKRVCCANGNTIVAAGAGSGKTQVLATRFAYLVMSKDIKAKEILTLTFTKKAAAEMYARIYSILKFFAENDKTPTFERNRAKEALKDFSEVHIQTLDSYCASIVKQAANRYGISPDFSGEGEKTDAYTAALEFLLERKDDPTVKFFYYLGNVQTLAQTISSIVAKNSSISDKKDYYYSFAAKQHEFAIKSLNKLLKDFYSDLVMLHKQCEDNLEILGDYIQPISEYINIIKTFTDDSKNDKLEPGIFQYDENDNLIIDSQYLPILELDELISYSKKIENVVLQLKSNKFECRKKNGQETAKFLRTLCEEICKKFEKIPNIINFFNYEEEFSNFYKLVDEFAFEINKQKRIQGTLSFADISDLSLKILIEQSDIRHQEQNAFKRIMIDEFQDNNSKNRDLLFLLSVKDDNFDSIPYDENDKESLANFLKDKLEEDKLFFVGDEKQSIYRFRNAEVSVFNKLKDDLNTEPLNMSYNYRSTPELLASFNQIFGGIRKDSVIDDSGDNIIHKVFPSVPKYDYEAGLSESGKAKKFDVKNRVPLEDSVLTNENINTHLCLFNDNLNEAQILEEFKEDPNFQNKNFVDNFIKTRYFKYDDCEAYFISNKIMTLMKENPSLRFSDFAILGRTKTKRKEIIKWFNFYNIPYEVDEYTNIFEDALINDLYSFFRLCVYPNDKKAFASYLSSPLVNVSLESVQEILAAYILQKKSEKSDDNDIQAFKDDRTDNTNPFVWNDENLGLIDSTIKENINSTDFEKYMKAKEFFLENKSKALKQTLTQTLNDLWYSQGYLYEYLQNQSAAILGEQYDYLFELCHQCDLSGKGIGYFVETLNAVKTKETKSYGSDDVEVDIPEVKDVREKQDGVQLMTIHKSKGLQFKYVFLQQCVNYKERKEPVSGFSKDYGIFLETPDGKNGVYKNLLEIDKDLEIAERKRVVYVGLTRAEKEVFLLGQSKFPNKKTGELKLNFMEEIGAFYYPSWNSVTMENLYTDDCPFDLCVIEKVPRLAYKKDSASYNQSKIQELAQMFSSGNGITTPTLESYKTAPSSLETEGVELSTGDKPLEQFGELNDVVKVYENSGFNFADFGTLVHLCLQAQAQSIPVENFDDYEKLTKALSSKDKNLVYEICKVMCKNFNDSTYGKLLNDAKGANRFAKAEWEFSMFEDEKLFTGSIDLIFQNEDSTYTIVDYKSDNTVNLEKYIEQQRCYKKAAARMLQVSEDKISCYLYFLRYNKDFKLDL